jgi:hypothetical protein
MNGTPVFGCPNNWDSYTNEWIMLVGPGQDAWIQLGWERSQADARVHIWYQARGPNFLKDWPFDPTITNYRVDIPREFRIEAQDPGYGTVYWDMYVDDIYLDTIESDDLQWPGGSKYAVNAQWSGELSYIESEMGGPRSNPVAFYYPAWSLTGLVLHLA